MFMSIPTVTLMKEKSYISEPEAFASPPPNTVPPITMSPFSRVSSPTASYPMFVRVFPYTTDVFAPPYTFLPMFPPVIFTVLKELLVPDVPVAA